MPRTKLSIPVERRKAQLKSKVLTHRVKIAEHRDGLSKAREELKAMTPPRKTEE